MRAARAVVCRSRGNLDFSRFFVCFRDFRDSTLFAFLPAFRCRMNRARNRGLRFGYVSNSCPKCKRVMPQRQLPRGGKNADTKLSEDYPNPTMCTWRAAREKFTSPPARRLGALGSGPARKRQHWRRALTPPEEVRHGRAADESPAQPTGRACPQAITPQNLRRPTEPARENRSAKRRGAPSSKES